MRTLLTILIILFFGECFSQSFPQPQRLGNKDTYVFTDGTFKSNTGFTWGLNYGDTATANAADYISSTPGIVIRVNNTEFYVRNQTVNRWVQVGGGGSGTLTSASQGLTSVLTDFRLGQTVSEAGDPAIFTSNREIPTGGAYFDVGGSDVSNLVVSDAVVSPCFGSLVQANSIRVINKILEYFIYCFFNYFK